MIPISFQSTSFNCQLVFPQLSSTHVHHFLITLAFGWEWMEHIHEDDDLFLPGCQLGEKLALFALCHCQSHLEILQVDLDQVHNVEVATKH